MAPKKKQEKMNLGEFLTNQSLGSWADEMDSQPMPAMSSQSYGARDRGDRDGGERRAFTQPAWETARAGSGMGGGFDGSRGGGMGDRGASYDRPRFSDREQLPLPDKPPYTAHLGNLAYDVTSVDVENFFKDCEITNVRLVEDKLDRKPKGFGYVEFASLEGLKKALTYTETNFQGRNIKISVAEPPKDRPEPTRDFSDWSRKGPLPELPQNTRQGSNRGFPSRSFDNMSDAGSERGGPKRGGFFENDNKVRDFNTWERKGPLSPVPGALPMRDGGRLREGGPPGERRRSPAWGEGRSDAGSRPPRREFEPRPPVERVPTAAETATQWRSNRPDPSPVPTPEASTPSSPQPQAPKERPRLNLAKRTVSTAENDEAAPATASDSKASPFGAARPVDTAAKEREAAEKLQLAQKQKREAEEKAREEKASREAAARASRAERADRGQAQEDEPVTSPTSENSPKGRRVSRPQNGIKPAAKENGEAPTLAKPNFSILRRDIEGDEEDADAADAEGEDQNANGNIIQDKEIKPQEPVVEKTAGADQATDPTAQALEEEGWSTVGNPKQKNSRRGGARALAS